MIRKAGVVLAAAAVLGIAVLAQGANEVVTKKVDMQGADELVVNGDLGAGKFTILPKDMTEGAVIEIDYNPKRVDYSVESEVKRGKCFLDFESEHRSKHNFNTEDNVWDITLSTRYATSVKLDIGACEAHMDFGGVPLTDLTLDIGAASGKIDFSAPNPQSLDEINIDAGASSVSLRSIGNSNFKYLSFSGGAGSFDLDFRGDLKGEAKADIDIGLGSAEIILPEGTAVRIESEGSSWLSSIDFDKHGLDEVEDGVYESPDFDKADIKITLNVEVGMGSVDIVWK